MLTTKVVRYTSFEDLFNRKSSTAELVGFVKGFSRESIIYTCAMIGACLKSWRRGDYDAEAYDFLVRAFSAPVLGEMFVHEQKLSEPFFLFHQRQLLLLEKMAILHSPVEGTTPLQDPTHRFSIGLLMANDNFHFGIPSTDDDTHLVNLFAELVPTAEYVGARLQCLWGRSNRMLGHLCERLSGESDFVDIPKEFKVLTGLSVDDYQTLCFAALSQQLGVTLNKLNVNPFELYITPQTFALTSVAIESIQAFFGELSSDVNGYKAEIQRRDFGSNDFTSIRKKPLYSSTRGCLCLSQPLMIEKLESGPFWRVHDAQVGKGQKLKLRSFWGKLFEAYVNEHLSSTMNSAVNIFHPDPRYESNQDQACDSIVINPQERSLVMIEYKASMFTAERKYGGNPAALMAEIEEKLVETNDGEKKGVLQLISNITRLFDKAERVPGIDTSTIDIVYPVLVLLDNIGAVPILTRILNKYFSKHLPKAQRRVEVRPLLCIHIEALEVIAGYLSKQPFCAVLQGWLDNDPSLTGTVLMVPNPSLRGSVRNPILDRQTKELFERTQATLFPGTIFNPPTWRESADTP